VELISNNKINMKKVINVYQSGLYEVIYERKNFLIFTWLEKISTQKIANEIIIQTQQDSYPPERIVVLGVNGGELEYRPVNTSN